jgi:hypothetical protein
VIVHRSCCKGKTISCAKALKDTSIKITDMVFLTSRLFFVYLWY